MLRANINTICQLDFWLKVFCEEQFNDLLHVPVYLHFLLFLDSFVRFFFRTYDFLHADYIRLIPRFQDAIWQTIFILHAFFA